MLSVKNETLLKKIFQRKNEMSYEEIIKDIMLDKFLALNPLYLIDDYEENQELQSNSVINYDNSVKINQQNKH